MGTKSDQLPRVPESLLKRRKEYQAIKAKQAQAAIVQKKANKAKQKLIFKRAEQYIAEYRKKEKDVVRLNRMAKKQETTMYLNNQNWLLLSESEVSTRSAHKHAKSCSSYVLDKSTMQFLSH